MKYLLILLAFILAMFARIIYLNIDNFEKEINVDSHNGFIESEFYDDNLE